jgi:hypothetical protein
MKKERPGYYTRKEDITTEEIGNLESFKDWDEPKKAALARIIKTFAEITFHIYSHKKKAGKVIVLNIDNKTTIAA